MQHKGACLKLRESGWSHFVCMANYKLCLSVQYYLHSQVLVKFGWPLTLCSSEMHSYSAFLLSPNVTSTWKKVCLRTPEVVQTTTSTWISFWRRPVRSSTGWARWSMLRCRWGPWHGCGDHHQGIPHVKCMVLDLEQVINKAPDRGNLQFIYWWYVQLHSTC